jgi:hypothetical protein
MIRRSQRSTMLVCLSGWAAIFCTNSVHADNPSWAEQQARNAEMQRQALQQQAQQQPRPQVVQYERWKQEWFQQHPNDPLPTLGELEKMHRGEILNTMNNDFARMRAARQAQLQAEYRLSKQHQQQILASQHITWTAQQWANWDREYDQQQQQRAREYLEAVKQSGEQARMEAAEEERRRIQGY